MPPGALLTRSTPYGGHSQKLVAHELGCTPSTVCELVRSGLGKLGLRSNAELLAVLAEHVPAKPHT